MMYRIRIFSDFCDSKECKENIERMCEANLIYNYGPNQEIYITDSDFFTHALVLNTASPIITFIPKKNIVGMALEPPEFLNINNSKVNINSLIEYVGKYVGKYFIGDKGKFPKPFVEGQSFLWHITPPKELPIKNKKMSIILSEKRWTFCQNYRHIIAREILKSNLPIDIYGKGVNNDILKNDNRIKGAFKDVEPYENYHFHICIENFQTPHYFSEKIINPLLYGITPIYIGCYNIDTYFPSSVIKLSGSIDKDMELIKDIIYFPEKYKKDINIEMVKNKTNLLKNLDKIFA